MKNFLDQDIQVGDTVMRGAPLGSSILFEFGIVRGLVDKTSRVKVDWYLRTYSDSESRKNAKAPMRNSTYGSHKFIKGTGVDIDKVVLSPITLQEYGVTV